MHRAVISLRQMRADLVVARDKLAALTDPRLVDQHRRELRLLAVAVDDQEAFCRAAGLVDDAGLATPAASAADRRAIEHASARRD